MWLRRRRPQLLHSPKLAVVAGSHHAVRVASVGCVQHRLPLQFPEPGVCAEAQHIVQRYLWNSVQQPLPSSPSSL